MIGKTTQVMKRGFKNGDKEFRGNNKSWKLNK